MKARRFFAFVAGAAMLFGAFGCTPENGEENSASDAEITVTPASIATTLEGSVETLTVTSNAKWVATCDQSDVVLSTVVGNGNATVTLTIPAVTTARTFNVKFLATKSVEVAGIPIPSTAEALVSVSQNASGVDMNDYLYYEDCGADVEKITLENGNTAWPYIDQFSEWNPKGSAATNVSYAGKSASVRDSGVNYDPTEDAVGLTGAPYVFLNKVPSEAQFVIENLAVTGGQNYIFTYNVSCQNGYNPLSFATVDNTLVHLELGYDGQNWDAVDCTFAPNGGNGWYAATAEFKVAANATKLYARFTYEAPASNGGGRFDDFKLVQGGNGAELAPEAPVVSECTIAQITAVGDYTVKNAWVVATYASGCLLTDASGAYILAYSPSVTPAVGEVIDIEGAVTEYAQLLQFGAGAVVTTTGETKTVTHPTPEVLTGSTLDAYLGAPTIKYVEYSGTLSISSGKYYNVVVPGAVSAQGSISYPGDDIKATLTSLDGKAIKVTGYLIGISSSKYTNTMAVSVEETTLDDSGNTDDNTDLPEGASLATIVFSQMGYTDRQVVDGETINVDDVVSLVFKKGSSSTAPAYYDLTQGIRMYQNGSTLDVTATGKTIISIEILFDYNMWYVGCDTGTLSAEAAIRTWTGEASAVKFTSTGTDKDHRAYIKSIKVIYK